MSETARGYRRRKASGSAVGKSSEGFIPRAAWLSGHRREDDSEEGAKARELEQTRVGILETDALRAGSSLEGAKPHEGCRSRAGLRRRLSEVP